MPEYNATVTVPQPVTDYFAILAAMAGEGGQVSAQPAATRATVIASPQGDDYSLGRRVRDAELALAQLTGFPVHAPRLHPGSALSGLDETAIADPTETPAGWLFKINYSHEVRTFFGTIIGVAALDYTPGQPTATITFTEEDRYTLGRVVADLEDELASWGLGDITISEPAAV